MIEPAEILKGTYCEKREPAKPETIQNLNNSATDELPKVYPALLRYSDGGEGKLNLETGWFMLWSSTEVIELNKGYEIDKNLPGYFGFGSNGGGELLVFDIESGRPWKVVMIPFIPMSAKEAEVIANNFEEFIKAIGRDF